MDATLQFATLVVSTMFAVGAAVGLHWLGLKATFLVMRPATAQRIPFERTQGKSARTELVSGTARVARAYSGSR